MRNLLTFVEQTLAVCWQRIEVTGRNDACSLALFRMFWGTYILLFFAPYSAWVSQVPQSFFKPPVLSLAFLFSGFPPYPVMLAADLARIWLVALITIGLRARVCTIILCLLTLFSSNFVYSFGKIDHDIVVWVVSLCLAFTDWGVPYALVPDRCINPRLAARASATAGVLIAFAMFTAGFEKALHWINFDFSTAGFLSWFYPGYYTLGRTALLAPLVLKVPPHFFKVADYTAVVFELSAFVFLLAGRAAWRAWLLAAAVFHVMNALLLNIPFYLHVLVYLPFISFARIFKRTRDGGGGETTMVFVWQVRVAVFVVILGIAHTAQRLGGGGANFLFVAGYSDPSSLVLYGSLALLVFCVVVIAVDLWDEVTASRSRRKGDSEPSVTPV